LQLQEHLWQLKVGPLQDQIDAIGRDVGLLREQARKLREQADKLQEQVGQLQQATGQVRVGKLDVQLAHLFEQMVTQTGVDQLRQQILGELEWHQVISSQKILCFLTGN